MNQLLAVMDAADTVQVLCLDHATLAMSQDRRLRIVGPPMGRTRPCEECPS